MSDIVPRCGDHQQPRWQPLSAIDRRVLGVLVEKGKTTPDGYPMTVNSLRSGCNQKNNRYPLMELELEDVEESLSRLRTLGAVAEVQGGGRVPKYRHYMYEWLGVEKLELAVMTELLLRGAQTEGELRGRAARMDPIPDLNALRPVLAALRDKGLIISLTPEGRGHALSHALYEPRELEKVRAEFHSSSPAQGFPAAEERPVPAANPPGIPLRQAQATTTIDAPNQAVKELRRELEEVRAEMTKLRKDLDDLWSNFR
jgi:uncharacterized protein